VRPTQTLYDFNAWTEKKRIEKLRYIHRNPVVRGLVESPEQWRWSSFRWYLSGEIGPVKINDTEILVMKDPSAWSMIESLPLSYLGYIRKIEGMKSDWDAPCLASFARHGIQT
jgi:hypothetical protein